jgi:hypothetical protein
MKSILEIAKEQERVRETAKQWIKSEEGKRAKKRFDKLPISKVLMIGQRQYAMRMGVEEEVEEYRERVWRRHVEEMARDNPELWGKGKSAPQRTVGELEKEGRQWLNAYRATRRGKHG